MKKWESIFNRMLDFGAKLKRLPLAFSNKLGRYFVLKKTQKGGAKR